MADNPNNSNNSNNSAQVKLLEQPWFQKAYKSAVEFYKYDEVLQPEDRLSLSQSYVRISKSQFWGGWLAFSLVFVPPFIQRYYRTNSIKGVKLARNFILGSVAMFIGSNFGSSYMYRKILDDMKPEFDYGDAEEQSALASKRRQYNIMKLIKDGSSNKWASYFMNTYHDPGRRLPNPETKLRELQAGKVPRVNPVLDQRDPMGLYTSPKKQIPQEPKPLEHRPSEIDSLDGWTSGWPEEPKKTTESAWNRVRQQNTASNPATSNTWESLRQRSTRPEQRNGDHQNHLGVFGNYGDFRDGQNYTSNDDTMYTDDDIMDMLAGEQDRYGKDN
ncbi:HCL189Cp [Eremothecium sinecaudum]|uniref:HCL189Cp n=1 Tax=Eremothecium sinecaudum TaxID=45286 RepID=A0A0X8HR82_9SACH|nr:HCL189Cp [Eremothecium sinecaudum]AMD19962.1 HCL189Cp [Eremothecium sinecaudum]